MIGAYAHGFGFTGLVFRFVSVLGERYTHGHVIDFYRALKPDPSRLQVLGDGRQTKTYLYVQDCVEAIARRRRPPRRGPRHPVYNFGTDETSPSTTPSRQSPTGWEWRRRSRRRAASAAGPATPP